MNADANDPQTVIPGFHNLVVDLLTIGRSRPDQDNSTGSALELPPLNRTRGWLGLAVNELTW